MHYLIQVNVMCEEISTMIQKKANKLGWKWSTEQIGFYKKECLYLLLTKEKYIQHTGKYEHEYGKLLTIEETLKWLEQEEKKLKSKPIKIGEWEVKVHGDNIGIGCQSISKADIKKVYDKFFS